VSRWLRLIYPAGFARRHADEIASLLKTSPQPIRDHLDVVIHALRLRSEHVMNQLPRHLADVALAVTIFLLGFVLNDLDNGVSELVQHWWSTAAVLLVAVACAARVAAGIVDRRRTNRPERTTP
jgi:hypothetical protein